MNEMIKLSEFATQWAINCQQTSAHHAAKANATRNLLRASNSEHAETIVFAIEQQKLTRVWARRAQDILGLWD